MREDAYTVFFSRQNVDGVGDAILGHVGEYQDHQGEFSDPVKLLPLSWEGKYKVHLYPIERFIADLGEDAVAEEGLRAFAAEEVSHIALVEGTQATGKWRFDHKDICNVAALYLYSANRKAYRLLHCFSCAQIMCHWMAVKEGEWSAGSGLQSSTHAYN